MNQNSAGRRIAFIGCGNMGSALMGGLIRSGYPRELVSAADQDPVKTARIATELGIHVFQDNAEAARNADALVLAVKPQVIAEVLSRLTDDLDGMGGRLIISMAAGVTLNRIGELTRGHRRIVRLMPNTPALVGCGVTGMFAAPEVSDEEKEFAGSVLKAVGETVWVSREEDMNTVTAASGSAPAYFFLLMQYMIECACAMGLTPEQARILVTRSAQGSAELALQRADVSLETLRAQVTSKGGTTHAAVTAFEEADLKKAVFSAMEACVARAKEMEKLF